MNPLPPPLGAGGLTLWRLDQTRHAATWDSGEGSFRAGGRWNPRGAHAVYAALDPATAILEVAVHKTFETLDIVPHTLTAARIVDLGDAHVVMPDDVPNANWLRPGAVSSGQQAFGGAALRSHIFLVVPSVVSANSWNVVFEPGRAADRYAVVSQAAFALDPRLHPPPPPQH